MLIYIEEYISHNIASDIRPQWRLKSAYASTWQNFAFLAIQNESSEDSDHIVQMCRRQADLNLHWQPMLQDKISGIMALIILCLTHNMTQIC